MSTKLKAIGLGFAALLAMSAFAVMNASAEEGGHFTSDSENEKTVITGTEEHGTEHSTSFEVPGLSAIECEHVQYDGTVVGNTQSHIFVTPTYGTNNCFTGEDTPNTFTVHHNGCGFTFAIGKKATGHNTVSVICPEGKAIEVTHPSCTIKVPEQKLEGVSYTTDEINGKHAITLDATVEESITTHFESGFCVLLGTKHISSFQGSATITGWEDAKVGPEDPTYKEGEQVNITATGSED